MAKAQKTTDKPSQKSQRSRGAKWTRRGVISAGVVAGGALVIGVALRPGHRETKLAQYVAGEGEALVTAWVKIAADNTVTAIIPHGEMGQGIHTALSAMLAEEMDADWDAMSVIEAPAEKEYANFPLVKEFLLNGKKPAGFVHDTLNGAFLRVAKSMDMQITGGSTSVRFTGVGAMQTAGAAARELLIRAAAEEWDVPSAELSAKKSYIFHASSGKSAPFAQFAQRAAEHKPNINPKLKARKDYTVMGQSLPRIDIPPKVDGSAMFGIDIELPNMVYATVKSAPVLGNTVASVNDAEARTMPGVLDVVNLGDCVAVIANGYWQAKQGLEAVEISFTANADSAKSQADIYAQYGQALDAGNGGKAIIKRGNMEMAAKDAASTFAAEYQVPFLAHATMEPMTAVAQIKDGRADIWTGTQNPLGTRSVVAKTLGMKFDDVQVHNQFLGGGFGRRATPDYILQAARLAQLTDGKPVKLIWSREEDMQQDHYRPAAIARLSANIGADGYPLSWNNYFVHKHDPPEASHIFYNIPNQNISFVESPSHIRFGPWRSVDHTQHGFFTESFIDELAHEAGKDPYEYRRHLLAGKPRHLAVLDAAAKAGNWGKPLPSGQARGIAIAESFMTIVAEVVTVDVTGAEPRVLHVSCAADAGFVVNPDGFIAQMESGILYGLTAALYGDITIADGAVEQSNFHDYQMVRMDNSPDIDVVIINSDARIGGAGEPGTPPIAPALSNALFAATGQRVRALPTMHTDFNAGS